VSAHRHADFEWYAHERIGRAAGLSDDEIAAIRRSKKIATLDAGETLVRRLVRMLLRERDLDRAAFEEARDVLGARALMDLIALVGYYDTIALSLRVWRTPLPVGETSPFRKGARRKAATSS
jgi:hypothetical protein